MTRDQGGWVLNQLKGETQAADQVCALPKFRVGMAHIWRAREQQSRRFVASKSPLSHRLRITHCRHSRTIGVPEIVIAGICMCAPTWTQTCDLAV